MKNKFPFLASVVIMMSCLVCCTDQYGKSEDKVDLLRAKALSLDSFINNETKKLHSLDSVLSRELAKAGSLDSIVNRQSIRIDSLKHIIEFNPFKK